MPAQTRAVASRSASFRSPSVRRYMAVALRSAPRRTHLRTIMRGLYYHFNNLRFNTELNINDLPIPISSVFLRFKCLLF